MGRSAFPSNWNGEARRGLDRCIRLALTAAVNAPGQWTRPIWTIPAEVRYMRNPHVGPSGLPYPWELRFDGPVIFQCRPYEIYFRQELAEATKHMLDMIGTWLYDVAPEDEAFEVVEELLAMPEL